MLLVAFSEAALMVSRIKKLANVIKADFRIVQLPLRDYPTRARAFGDTARQGFGELLRRGLGARHVGGLDANVPT